MLPVCPFTPFHSDVPTVVSTISILPETPPVSANFISSIAGLAAGGFTYASVSMMQVLADPMQTLPAEAFTPLGVAGLLASVCIWTVRKLIAERDARLAETKALLDEYRRKYEAIVEHTLANPRP